MHIQLLLIALVATALLFDFLNGLHDAANSIATIVSTRVLSPRYAVGWAAFFNFIAFLVFGLHVAKTIGTGIVAPSVITDQVDLWRLDGRDRVECDHLAWRHSLQQFARLDRWVGRIRCCAFRLVGHRLDGPWQDHRRDFLVAGARLRARIAAGSHRVLGVRAHAAGFGRDDFSPGTVRFRFALLSRSRRQRRAEDDGDHRGAPRSRMALSVASSLSHFGSC